jgi:DNA ligase (NAD+)
MGRTGQLTPVAIYEDVDIEGTICNRASLHNLSIMYETLGLYPEQKQKIWIYKANKIIPQIARAVKNDIPHDHILDSYPIFCPICGEETKLEKSENGVLNVICGNPHCEGKLENQIDHYLGKKGLDIKGISKMTIRKLIEWGWVQHTVDIYLLNTYRNMWIDKPGFGIASVDKILNAIKESQHNVVLSDYISAIGIPLVGKTIAKEITKYYTTWADFREAVGGDWTEFEGFGPEISKAINNFDYQEADMIAEQLEFAEARSKENKAAAAIKDKKFCATGKLQNFTRDSLKADIEAHGGKLVSSVTSATDYLITNTPDSGTSKNRDAQRLGVKIITEEEYLKMKS